MFQFVEITYSFDISKQIIIIFLSIPLPKDSFYKSEEWGEYLLWSYLLIILCKTPDSVTAEIIIFKVRKILLYTHQTQTLCQFLGKSLEER